MRRLLGAAAAASCLLAASAASAASVVNTVIGFGPITAGQTSIDDWNLSSHIGGKGVVSAKLFVRATSNRKLVFVDVRDMGYDIYIDTVGIAGGTMARYDRYTLRWHEDAPDSFSVRIFENTFQQASPNNGLQLVGQRTALGSDWTCLDGTPIVDCTETKLVSYWLRDSWSGFSGDTTLEYDLTAAELRRLETTGVLNIRAEGTAGVFEEGSYEILMTLSDGPPVPEPSTWALMVAGFGALGAALRRRAVAEA